MKSKVFVLFSLSCALLSLSLAGQSQVSFFQPPTYSGNGSVFVADFNADGKPDLLTSDGTMNLGNGDGTFKLGTPVTSGRVYVEVLGDFNGDNKADLLVEEGVSTYFVLLGNGDGTFQPPISTAINVAFLPGVADLNGDGKADVVDGYGGSLYVFISNGDGTFQPGVGYSPGPSGTVLIADFNGDGKNDVVLETSLQLVVFLGNGDGTLQTPTYSTGINNGSPVLVGDFNGDGKLDLIAASAYTSSYEYLALGNGDGTFQTPTALFSITARVTTADVNADGKLDLIFSGGLSSDQSAGTVPQIYLGNGDGSFSGPTSFVTNFLVNNSGGFLAISDLNLDGKLDIASSGSILLGNGDGTFQAIPLTTFSLPPISVAVGDFEKNGKPDVAVVTSSQSGVVTSNLYILHNNSSGGLSVLHTYSLSSLGSPGFPLVGDLNGDGNLDLVVLGSPPEGNLVLLGNGDGSFQSPVVFQSGYFGVGILADLNQDKKLDLVEEWGTSIGVSLGNGDGTFASTVEYGIYTLGPALVIGDFNGDGTLDVGYHSGMYEIDQNYTEIMYGNGDGTFQTAIIPADLKTFGAVATADFRNMGRADLFGDNSIALAPTGNQVALNNGDGTFTVLPALPYEAFPLPDINGDGKVDLFVPNTPESSWSPCQPAVALGDGNGTFSSPVNVLEIGCYPLSPFSPIVDMNGDGRPDIVFVRGPGVGVLLNTTASSFELFPSALSPATTTAGTSATSTVLVVPTFGFNETVNLSCAGMPNGVTCALNPSSVANSSGNSTLTITTSSSTAAGTYPIQVQGAAGSISNTAALNLVVQAVPDFSFSPATGSPTSQTIASGQAASFILTLAASGSFAGPINLSCAITPNVSMSPTCSLPPSIQITNSGSQSVNVIVGTTAPVTTNALPRFGFPSGDWRLIWALMLLGTASLCNLRRKRISALVQATVVTTVVGLAACGGNNGSSSGSHTTPGTPAGTYTTTITASSGNLSHSTTLTLVVK